MDPRALSTDIPQYSAHECTQNPVFQSRKTILCLPTELLQLIACSVTDDADFCNMALACRQFAAAILPSWSGVWRSRFLQIYDPPPANTTSEDISTEFKSRRIILSRTPSFQKGEGAWESLWLESLTSLIIDSYNPYGCGRHERNGTSHNMRLIKKYVVESDFLNRPIIGDELDPAVQPSESFYAVQLALTHLALDLNPGFRSLRTDYDIVAVYSYKTVLEPIVSSYGVINLAQILHIRNFWKRHLTNADEGTFYSAYREVAVDRAPKAWDVNLSTAKELSSQWLGYYSCVHPYPSTLGGLQNHQTCAALDGNWATWHELRLDLTFTSNASVWPNLFYHAMPSYEDSGSEKTYFHGIQSFNYKGKQERYPLRGFTQDCGDHGGIPGWRSVYLVIYQLNPDLFSHSVDDDPIEYTWSPQDFWSGEFLSLYWYEGIVLPGGKIILGRWGEMLSSTDFGPFIFWEI